MSRERRKLYLVIFVLIYWISRIPFLSVGYGLDSDAWRIVRSAQYWDTTGEYRFSRYPGFPFMEFVVRVLLKLDSCVLTNLFVAFLGFLICLIVWDLIRRKVGEFAGFVGATTLALWGVFWISTVETMDIIPALFFSILAFWMIESGYSWVIAALFAGVGVGLRITSVLIVPVLMLMVYFRVEKEKVLKSIIFGVLSLLPGVVVYGYIFAKYGVGTPSARFLVKKALYYIYTLVGLWSAVAFVGLLVRYYNLLGRVVKEYWNYIAVVVIYLLFFFRFPYDTNYLVPLMPFVIVVFAGWLGRYLKPYVFLSASLVLNSFVMVDVKYLTPVEEKLRFRPRVKPGLVLEVFKFRKRGAEGVETIKKWAKSKSKNEKVIVLVPYYMEGPLIVDDTQLERISDKWLYVKRVKGTDVILAANVLNEREIKNMCDRGYKFILPYYSVRQYESLTGKSLLSILKECGCKYEYVSFDDFGSFFAGK